MVLFLKAQSVDLTSDISMICKMMYNIECNRNVFNLTGGRIDPELQKNTFNEYTYKQVTYNITPSYGVLVIYDNATLPTTQIANLLSEKFRDLNCNYDINELSPCYIQQYKSTAYTMISRKTSDLHSTSLYESGVNYRKIITDASSLDRGITSGTKFIWYVVSCSSNTKYLQSPELYDGYPTEQYLNSALSTVVYDGVGLLNVKHGMKQINYPSITQYTISTKSRIITDVIYIGRKTGLLLEIATYYADLTLNKYMSQLFIELPKHFHDFTIECVEYNTTQVRRLDLSKHWSNQLITPWDYKEQEDKEENIMETGKPAFPNDVCFISQTPLYDTVYLLEVTHKQKRAPVISDIDTDDKNTNTITITSRIFVSPYSMHCEFTTKKSRYDLVSLPEYLNSYGIQITGCNTVKYPRTELTTIEEISSDIISDEKRKLLCSISKFGCFEYFNYENAICYAVDVDANQVYAGFTKYINDSHIIKFNNTKTILFRYHKIN
jgi:hypothetical protein